MSDYGSDIEEWTADVLLAADDTEYGSEVEDEVARDLETNASAAFARERALNLTKYRLQMPIELPSDVMAPSSQADRLAPNHKRLSDTIIPQTGSAFLQLPAELRNTIYAALFENTTCQLGVVQYRYSCPVGILLACKQTHLEAVGLYYNVALFVATDYYTLRRCLKKLPLASRTLISRVGLHSLELRKEYYSGDFAQYAQMAEADIQEARSAFKVDPCLHVQPGSVTASFLSPTGKVVWSQTPWSNFRNLQQIHAQSSSALQDTLSADNQSVLDDNTDGTSDSESSISEADDRREGRQPIGIRTFCRR